MTSRADRRRERRRLLLRWSVLTAGGVCLLIASLVIDGTLAGFSVVLLPAAGLFWLGDRGMRRPGAIPVIVYHSVSPDPTWLPWGDSISVRPQTFRLHMDVLRRMKRKVISSRELVAARRDKRPVDPRSVVLHFDDGYLDNFLEAAPVLREFGYPATIFASAHFIDAGETPRGAGDGWRGYMNRAELRAMDSDPLIEIASHGLDHGRIPVSTRQVGRLDAANWRRYAPQIWARTPGPKARWFLADDPAPMRLGDPIFDSDSKLCGRWLHDGGPHDAHQDSRIGQETEAERDARVEAELREAREVLSDALGRPVDFLCWPFDRWTEAARAAARRAGITTFTGGRGENRADEDPDVLSRVHVHDYAFGGGPLWLEGLAFRAKVGSMSGNVYWSVVVMAASASRLCRFSRPGAHE